MVLGGLWCPLDRSREIAAEIRALKVGHGLRRHGEVKWSKVAPSNLAFYKDLVNYFFETPDLRFRAVIVPDKSILRHAEFSQHPGEFYFKMFYVLLKGIVGPWGIYRIFLDVKDTNSEERKNRLHEIICNSLHDFERKRVQSILVAPSHEIQQIQLADLLIGAVSAAVRSSTTSPSKLEIRSLIESLAGHPLTTTTGLSETKFNILRWRPKAALESQTP